jgi:hypothetical protein
MPHHRHRYSESPDPSELPQVNTAYFKTEALDLMRKSGVYIKKGKFTQSECKIIEEKINAYLEDNGISEEDFLAYIRDPNSTTTENAKKASGVSLYVAKFLPGRYVNSVNQMLKRKYNIFNHHGKWTLEEDQKLLQLYALNGRNWKATAMEIGRTPLNCKDRYKLLEGQRCNSSGSNWTEEEEERLREIVMARMNGQPDLFLDWIGIATALGTKNEKQCKAKWHYDLSNRKVCRRDLVEFSLQEDRAICMAIRNREYFHEKDIVWSALFRDIPNRSRVSIWTRWKHLKRALGNVRGLTTLEDVVDAILQQIDERERKAKEASSIEKNE